MSRMVPLTQVDQWPRAQREQEALLLALDQSERLRLCVLEPDPVRRDRIVDRAMDRLLRRVSDGDPPALPRAWFRKTVNHLLISKEIPRRRTVPIHSVAEPAAPDEAQLAREREADAAEKALLKRRSAWLRQNLERLGLDERERAIVIAALDQPSIKAAARAVNMAPSNFRRILFGLASRISSEIRGLSGNNSRDSVPSPPS